MQDFIWQPELGSWTNSKVLQNLLSPVFMIPKIFHSNLLHKIWYHGTGCWDSGLRNYQVDDWLLLRYFTQICCLKYGTMVLGVGIVDWEVTKLTIDSCFSWIPELLPKRVEMSETEWTGKREIVVHNGNVGFQCRQLVTDSSGTRNGMMWFD